METDPGDEESADSVGSQLNNVKQRHVHDAVGLGAATWPVLVAFDLHHRQTSCYSNCGDRQYRHRCHTDPSVVFAKWCQCAPKFQ